MAAPFTIDEFFDLPVWTPEDGKKAYYADEAVISKVFRPQDNSSWSLICASDGRFMRRRDA